MTELEPFKKRIYDYSGLVLDDSLAEQRLHKCLQQAQQQLGLDAAQYLGPVDVSSQAIEL